MSVLNAICSVRGRKSLSSCVCALWSNWQHHNVLTISFVGYSVSNSVFLYLKIQQPSQSFQRWKERTEVLPEKDVSVYSMPVPPITVSVLLHLLAMSCKAVQQVCLGIVMLGYYGDCCITSQHLEKRRGKSEIVIKYSLYSKFF